MYRKKRNSTILFLLFGIAAIPVLLGITIAQAEKKVIFKIPKDKKKITAPSKKPTVEEKPEIAVPSKKPIVEEKPKITVPPKEPIVEKKIETDKVEGNAGKEKGEVAYFYNPVNKVDPFKSFILIKKEIEEKEKPRTYLETLEISQLNISAIVLTDKGNWALVRDSKGDGHVIQVGTPVGKKRGRVVKISENEVIVREYYSDIRGKKIENDVSIKILQVD